MSKTATAALPAAGAPPAPARRKSKLLLVLSIVFVLAAGGGGAAWWFLGHGAAAEVKQEKRRPPVFHTLEPFTVNLAEENGDHYLQMAVVYEMTDEKAVEQLKTYLPVIRNRILMLLSAKRPSELASPEGKQRLVAELVAAARESIPAPEGAAAVAGAYLGAFVVQ